VAIAFPFVPLTRTTWCCGSRRALTCASRSLEAQCQLPWSMRAALTQVGCAAAGRCPAELTPPQCGCAVWTPGASFEFDSPTGMDTVELLDSQLIMEAVNASSEPYVAWCASCRTCRDVCVCHCLRRHQVIGRQSVTLRTFPGKVSTHKAYPLESEHQVTGECVLTVTVTPPALPATLDHGKFRCTKLLVRGGVSASFLSWRVVAWQT
jgi:hypothetical protein